MEVGGGSSGIEEENDDKEEKSIVDNIHHGAEMLQQTSVKQDEVKISADMMKPARAPVRAYPEEKLCGWLVYRSRGLSSLKTNKQRWFQFGDENCKLYYYR